MLIFVVKTIHIITLYTIFIFISIENSKNGAFEAIRKEVQNHLKPEMRKYFKRSRSLLIKRFDTLKPEQKQAVNTMLWYVLRRTLRSACSERVVFQNFGYQKSYASEERTSDMAEFRRYFRSATFQTLCSYILPLERRHFQLSVRSFYQRLYRRLQQQN